MLDNIYLSIYHDLVNQIEQGTLPPDSKLPSENELAVQYGTSRETVRKALHLLSQHGYIHKIKGKGSFVLHVNKFNFPVSGLVSFKELTKRMRKNATTKVISLKRGRPSPYIATQLNISRTEEVWEVIRVREIDGEKIILDKDYFRSFIPPLTVEICEDSIYEYLDQTLTVGISFAKKFITIENITEEDQAWLDHKQYPMIAVVRNYVHLEDNTLFQYSESRHRPDKFRFVDFARRA
ncbi:trehalose operon repressor [Laceyella sacchari]|uniref:Trehalose operon repressor n=1 Tax=Laceyella tengchongensis TaxID=574699 RepID=A0AA45WKS9_9BACL|nr:trehalose operon repressor [Laceyella tengchongensis]AUS09204.1 trehalose operon repressor [Laceyella sacchari]SMP08766.1 GntR family transcriptional regulator, trehalose operon transcriptional repressor [Laceyella tengchongensis]